ncbi:MAG TPA: UvrB/UvrC motif-containing protein, partial [Candidatus Paceibacterota bacterium]|nr:UvrB/UvrC motif-containing protein [Candidatus Paceibacterota bacterium]
GITPQTIVREIASILPNVDEILRIEMLPAPKSKKAIKDVIKQKEKEMREAAMRLDFETAAILRDEIRAFIKEGKEKEKKNK